MKAYSQLTITDLVDTATYIYYAKDEQGTGASSVPSSDKKYIGFYNGLPKINGQPSSPTPDMKIEWFQYIGQKGEDGRGVQRTEKKYVLSSDGQNPPSSGWAPTIPAKVAGQYLWTRTIIYYSDNTNSTIDSVSYFPADGESHKIETTQEEILIFSEQINDKIVYTAVPEVLDISFKKKKENSNLLINPSDYTLTIAQKRLSPSSSNEALVPIEEKLKAKGLLSLVGEKWQLNLQELLTLKITDDVILEDIQETLKEESFLRIGITLKSHTEESNFKVIVCRMGTTSDMATFSLHAWGINAAVKDKKLTFDSKGLTIRNGSFQILRSIGESKTEEEKVLYFDNDSNNLVVKGKVIATEGEFSGELKAATGTFSGELSAATGSFSGAINAEKGSLNNITIGEGENFIQITKEGIQSKFDDSKGQGFLISSKGEIIANSISLGEKASIKNFLQLGENAKIYNPSINNHSFIEISNKEGPIISLKDNGTGAIGKILINGNKSIIATPSWSLSPDMATFHNATISGTINTSVFSTNSTQLSGSSFIYKDGILFSTENIVKNYVQTKTMVLKLDQEKAKKLDGKLVLISTEAKDKFFLGTAAIDKQTQNLIVTSLKENILEGNYTLAIILGNASEATSQVLKDWLIGINATAQDLRSLGLFSNSISFSEINFGENYNLSMVPKIILGKIPTEILSDNFKEDSIYGLYADSVFLTGTLSTKYSFNSKSLFAGVNTLSQAPFNKNFLDLSSNGQGLISIPDNSPIIFWAGAKDTSQKAIQDAPFQVTSNGTLYARQGYFEGSILTKATVKASTIETAVIVGSGQSESVIVNGKATTEEKAALTIKDATKGIVFEGNDKKYLELKNDSLKLQVPILFGDLVSKNIFHLSGIRSNHTKIAVNSSLQEKGIIIEPDGIGLSASKKAELSSSDIKITSRKDNTNKNILSIQNNESGIFEEIASIDKTNVNFSGKLQLRSGLFFGNSKGYLTEYRTVKNGVDIYIYQN